MMPLLVSESHELASVSLCSNLNGRIFMAFAIDPPKALNPPPVMIQQLLL